MKKESTKIQELKAKVGLADRDREIEQTGKRKDLKEKWEEAEWSYQQIKEPGAGAVWEDFKDILYFGIWFIIAGLVGGIWKIAGKIKDSNY
ncbi:MAG TPA: hypothetical protein VNM22_18695 [Candidatus Limnocylindrales bacterium]|nr:hypothetical protein [Candidatus Limnocylindrales bacterium]